MWRIIGAGWFPYVIFGVPALLAGVFGWGYLKGSNSAVAECEREKSIAVMEAKRIAEKQANRDAKTVAKVTGSTEGVRHEIRNIPASELCGPDGLQFFNAPVDIHNAHTGRTTEAAERDAEG